MGFSSWRRALLWSVALSCLALAVFAEEMPPLAKNNQVEDSVDVVAVPPKQDGAAPLDQEDTVGDEDRRTTATKGGEQKLDITFYHGFIASFSVIVVSELGDKTWFIAVIMAMRHSRITVFAGAMGALALMTVLSACLGWVTQLIPRAVTYYVSTALFFLFGLKMLHEGWHMSGSEGQEEFEEAQADVQQREMSMDSGKLLDMEAGAARADKNSAWAIFSFVSAIFVQAFTMTFIAEWGDRSQLTTIILGAREDIAGVIIGGVLGHALCTGIAVMGGKLVAQRISVRTVTLVGGVVFLIFALSAFIFNDVEQKPAVVPT
ncbi:hypothetical protein PRIPAC_93946 [Pristionchus pacificus]|uniref:GDT1 family protein n=1 Tax=Pristionchus pacificus TaxID=54126 RepID=A0A2A6B9Z3_PRIPA|nr:hypothetical protein PRIPAC_93946 [Pristionchus pacificus]|eukprot:PDM62687.1 hypothetical protein PRIPAC_49902 [Pristionchus pacificus]